MTTAAWALVHSANSTAVQISESVGPERVVAMARRLGFAGPIGPYRSIALGVPEVTVLEMAAAYAVLANYGLRVEPTLVARVVDPQGRTLFAHEPAIRRAVDPDLAAQMVHLLRQAVDRGTGRRIRALGFGGPAAGKTGTTNDNTDAWFTGFTPDLVASVWVRFDERENHRLVDAEGVQITGGSGATPIWAGFMTAVNAERPRRDFAVPAHLELVAVDPRTGIETARPDSTAPNPLSVLIRRGEEPNDPSAVDSLRQQHALAEIPH